jgi:hypothetical protein
MPAFAVPQLITTSLVPCPEIKLAPEGSPDHVYVTPFTPKTLYCSVTPRQMMFRPDTVLGCAGTSIGLTVIETGALDPH